MDFCKKKNMKNILFIWLLFACLSNYAQKKFSAEILTGFGLNKKILLVNEEVEDYKVFSTQINANYKLKIYNKFYGEVSLGAQWYFSSGRVRISSFNSTSLRLNIPLVLGYTILEKINIGGGIAFSNNRDFDDIDFRENDNLRASLLFKGGYLLNKNFNILLKISQNLSNIPDSYLLNQPNTDILLGIGYKLF